MMLSVETVTRQFGGFKAVDGVSLQLAEREILGIAGTNGAGKSTLFAAIAGQQPADAGRIRFDGHDITRLPPYRRARLGLVRTFQVPREFKSLSVHQNLLAAAANPQGERLLNAFVRTRSLRERITRLLGPMLNGGREPDLEEVASRLKLPTWTLRRKLAEAGTQFRAILTDTRRDLAMTYIRDTELAFGEIAYLLGFASAEAFQRAFKRWNSQTPGEFRRSQRHSA